MDVETIPHNKTQVKKYHVDLSEDPDIKPLIEKNADEYFVANKVNKEDMKRVLNKYATDPNMDLYTIAQAFNISDRELYFVLKMEEYREMYHIAKLRRGEMMVQLGFQVASTPYDKIQNGEEVSMVEVAAAKLKSNYVLTYGQALNTQFNPQKDKSSSGGGINVVVNTGVKLGF